MADVNWSWADYERCKRREERAAAKRAAMAEAEAKARHDAAATALTARIAARSAPPPTPVGKIDITAAPSSMETTAARWDGKGIAPGRLAQPVPVLCEGKVMCRCGAQGPGQTRGPVPVWFGDKCIEANCDLRGSSSAAVGAEGMRGSPRG